MKVSRWGMAALGLVMLLLAGCVEATASESDMTATDGGLQLAQLTPAPLLPPPASGEVSSPVGDGEIQLHLIAPHTTTSWDGRDPARVKFELPLLYLHRQREATPEAERTLEIQLTGFAGGGAIEMEAVSHHKKLANGLPHRVRETFTAPDRPCTAEQPCTFRWTFDAATVSSDYYDLRVKDKDGDLLWENPHPERPAFVALDTWDVGLGDHTVRITYGTLFPFARADYAPDSRLPHDGVMDFIEKQFVPIIVETWHTQVEEWGFGRPLHPDWDADRVVEVIITAPPFALFDGTGTFSVFNDAQGRLYPERRIWWVCNSNSFLEYSTLEDAYKALFSHEFFHLMQWNVLLHSGHPTHYWQFAFIEGQGLFAATAQYPELALRAERLMQDSSPYISQAANGYLARRLNGSFRDMQTDSEHRYDAALYWRFLYEQYGAMDVIRAALEEMPRHYQADQPDRGIVGAMGRVMDAAFERVGEPFRSYEESLVAFARANYALRLENGRCAAADLRQCDGLYYDPDGLYAEPRLEAALDYDGTAQTYRGAIPSSYGMDFVEVSLAPTLQGQPLTIQIQGEGTLARFDIQIWKLGSGGEKPRAITAVPKRVQPNALGDGTRSYTIPSVDATAYDRLALIITRLDADETAEPVGNYQVTIESTGAAVAGGN